MALAYTYEDTYIMNSVEISAQEASETKALTDLGMQGVTNAFYLEEMTKCLVYIDLAGTQLEAELMKDKVDHYTKTYKRYAQMDNIYDEDGGVAAVDDGVYSGKIGRG